jgi:hypothetical protein
MKKLLFVCLAILMVFTGFVPAKGDGEYKTGLKMLVFSQPGDLGIKLKNELLRHFPYINTFDSVVSWEAMEQKLRYDGYHIIALLGCQKNVKYDIPDRIEKLIDEHVRCGIGGLVVSGDIIAPGTKNEKIVELVGAQMSVEKRVGMTMVRVVDVTDPCVKDVAQSFQCNLGTIREAFVYPSAKKIAVTNDGTAVYWKHKKDNFKAAYISLGDSGEAITNIEISRLFTNVIYDIQGDGWLQALEAPRNVRCIAGDGKVKITWDAPVDPTKVAGYRIYRKSGGSKFTCIHDFPVLVDQPRELMDENVDNGKSYIYKICSIVPPDEIFAWSNDCVSSLTEVTPTKPILEIGSNVPVDSKIIGDKFIVRGKAPPGSKVKIEYILIPSGTKGVVEGVADADGNFAIEIPVEPGQTTEYYIIVENELGDQTKVGPYRVTADIASVFVVMTINSDVAYVNGFPWPENLKPAPYIKNGRTMVNFRFIGERLGATVDYFPKDGKPVQTVTYDIVSGVKGTVHIELFIGKPQYKLNGETKTLDAPPEIKSGRTMVPLRLISEAMGAKVDWNAEFRRVSINYPDPDLMP